MASLIGSQPIVSQGNLEEYLATYSIDGKEHGDIEMPRTPSGVIGVASSQRRSRALSGTNAFEDKKQQIYTRLPPMFDLLKRGMAHAPKALVVGSILPPHLDKSDNGEGMMQVVNCLETMHCWVVGVSRLDPSSWVKDEFCQRLQKRAWTLDLVFLPIPMNALEELGAFYKEKGKHVGMLNAARIDASKLDVDKMKEAAAGSSSGTALLCVLDAVVSLRQSHICRKAQIILVGPPLVHGSASPSIQSEHSLVFPPEAMVESCFHSFECSVRRLYSTKTTMLPTYQKGLASVMEEREQEEESASPQKSTSGSVRPAAAAPPIAFESLPLEHQILNFIGPSSGVTTLDPPEWLEGDALLYVTTPCRLEDIGRVVLDAVVSQACTTRSSKAQRAKLEMLTRVDEWAWNLVDSFSYLFSSEPTSEVETPAEPAMLEEAVSLNDSFIVENELENMKSLFDGSEERVTTATTACDGTPLQMLSTSKRSILDGSASVIDSLSTGTLPNGMGVGIGGGSLPSGDMEEKKGESRDPFAVCSAQTRPAFRRFDVEHMVEGTVEVVVKCPCGSKRICAQLQSLYQLHSEDQLSRHGDVASVRGVRLSRSLHFVTAPTGGVGREGRILVMVLPPSSESLFRSKQEDNAFMAECFAAMNSTPKGPASSRSTSTLLVTSPLAVLPEAIVDTADTILAFPSSIEVVLHEVYSLYNLIAKRDQLARVKPDVQARTSVSQW
uniref:Uncharacterized protein n=1 Tax=Palpitomonas bilix TaxID=652834 RepID=A0A7S3G928_9EUKA